MQSVAGQVPHQLSERSGKPLTLVCAMHLYAGLVRILQYAEQSIEDTMDDPLAHAASFNGSVPRSSPR